MAKIKKIIKKINVNADLCNGCRMCELMCAAFHATPQFNTVNPARSRIQIIRDPLKDIWLPVFAGEYTPAECSGRISYTIENKKYDECAFCRAVCPSGEDLLSRIPASPWGAICVKATPRSKCPHVWIGASEMSLTYEEREVEVEVDEEAHLDEMKTGLTALANQYGLDNIKNAVDRMSQNK